MTPGQLRYLRFFVFGTGFVVLVLEMAASRLLAPYFGASIFIWANIIGIILIALALGYWYGGRLADRKPSLTLLMKITIMAGIYVSVVPFVYRMLAPVVLDSFSQNAYSLSFGAFILILCLFAPPVFLLGMVSPFGVRLATSAVEKTGSSAGSLYAWSTVGSIVGTFITAFVAIPYIGTQETIFISAAILLLLGALGWRKSVLLLIFIPVGLFALLSLSTIFFANGKIRPRTDVVYERETPYQFIQVLERNNERLLITNEGHALQSVYMKNSVFTGHYFDYLTLLPPTIRKTGQSLDVLFIGVAGGTGARLYEQVYGSDYDLTMTGVDIDPGLIEAGRKYFELGSLPITIHIADGRSFLRQQTKKYDIVVVDVYTNQMAIPFHLATKEFFTLVADHLQSNGALVINFVAPNKNSTLFSSFLRTLATAFPTVSFIRQPNAVNYLVMASQTPLDFENAVYPASVRPIAEGINGSVEFYRPVGGLVFTDNRAPIELMTDTSYYSYVWNKAKL